MISNIFVYAFLSEGSQVANFVFYVEKCIQQYKTETIMKINRTLQCLFNTYVSHVKSNRYIKVFSFKQISKQFCISTISLFQALGQCIIAKHSISDAMRTCTLIESFAMKTYLTFYYYFQPMQFLLQILVLRDQCG